MISKERIAREYLLNQDFSDCISNRKIQDLQPWTPDSKLFQPVKQYCEQKLPEIREIKKKKYKRNNNNLSLQNENIKPAISQLDQLCLSQKLQDFKQKSQIEDFYDKYNEEELFTNRKNFSNIRDVTRLRSRAKNQNRVFFGARQQEFHKQKKNNLSIQKSSLNMSNLCLLTSSTTKNRDFKPNKSFWTNRFKISQEIRKLNHNKSFTDIQEGPLLEQAIKKLDQSKRIRSKSQQPKLYKEIYTRLTPQEKIVNKMKNEIINKYQKMKQITSLIDVGLPQQIVDNLNQEKNNFHIQDYKLNSQKLRTAFSVRRKNQKNYRMFFCDLIDTNRNLKLKTNGDTSLSQFYSNFFDLTSQ